MLHVLLNILYVPVCVFLILVVLLQTGKRADLAGAFGGGGSQTAFGARGAATLLTKLTTAAAVLFMLCALTLAIMSTSGSGAGRSVLDEVPETAPATAPVPLPPADLLPTDDGTQPEESTADPIEGLTEEPADLTGGATDDDDQP